MIKWFEESKPGSESGSGSGSKDSFTGRDSRRFLFNFMFLVEALEEGTAGQNYQQRIYGLALLCFYLRDSVSLFTRVYITDEQVSKLKELCYSYLRATYVFIMLTQQFGPLAWLFLLTLKT